MRRQGLPKPPPAPFAGPRNVRREQRRCCPPAPGRSVGGRAADGRAADGRAADGRTGHARMRPQLRRHSTGEKRKNRLRHESLVGSSVSLRGRTEETASQRRSSRKIRREQQIWPRGTAARLPGLVISTSLKGLTQFQLETNVELYWPARSRFLPFLLSAVHVASLGVGSFARLLRNHPTVSRHFSLSLALSRSLSFSPHPSSRPIRTGAEAQRRVSFE